MSSAPKIPVKFIVLPAILLQILLLCNIAEARLSARRGSELMCYSCMSRNIPNITKNDMSRTVNTPPFTQTDICNDPFSFMKALHHGVRVEPCSTGCIKVVSENRYIRIVLRGCLSTFFATQMEGLPQIMLPSIAYASMSSDSQSTCDVDAEINPSIGEIVTETCTCYENFCNAGQVYRSAVIMILTAAVFASAYHCL